MDSQPLRIIAVVDDLFFASKITAAAQAVSVPVRVVKDVAQLEQAIVGQRPALIMIDLNGSRFDAIAVIADLKSRAEFERVETIGFVSHVQADLIKRAQDAGCDQVMARSKFSQSLAEILTSHG